MYGPSTHMHRIIVMGINLFPKLFSPKWGKGNVLTEFGESKVNYTILPCWGGVFCFRNFPKLHESKIDWNMDKMQLFFNFKQERSNVIILV